ncbi:7184_t:CDS:2 [Gigaspora margarita]|uniref:7184_t:CDS:1 n=1 Tax=Gigaspora margarita TaxID=4874 RepID=A0ABN7V784_GIGMA|nr:7184_t:CDS:2 [Gigaspora margarita]
MFSQDMKIFSLILFVASHVSISTIFAFSQYNNSIQNDNQHQQYFLIFQKKSPPSQELLKNLSSQYSNVGELITFNENLHFLPGEFDNEFIEKFKDYNESEENSLNNKSHWIVAENGIVRALDNEVFDDYVSDNFDFQKFNQGIFENKKSNVYVQHSVQSWVNRINQRTPSLSKTYSYPESAGYGIDVYVVDTGIDIDHPEFEGRASWGITTTKRNTDKDENGHGTFVAGIIGGKTYGVAKRVNLIAVKSLDDEGTGSVQSVLYGLQYVIQSHLAKGGKGKTIVNLSLGSEYNRAVNLAVNELVKHGIIITVAAGNGYEGKGADACRVSPASARTAITVGSITPTDYISRFSNYDECVNIFAPGQGILSFYPFPSNGSLIKSGTSFACPYVSGVISLILSELKPQQMSLLSIKSSNARLMYIFNLLEKLATNNGISGLNGTLSPNMLVYNQVQKLTDIESAGSLFISKNFWSWLLIFCVLYLILKVFKTGLSKNF